MIPYGKQDISNEDVEAVIRVLKSDFLTQGPQVPLFESLVCKEVSAAHGVAVNSATSALHIACLALGVGPGDVVWTSPVTFVASANCARYCGANVDFVDINPDTYNLCPDKLEQKLIYASEHNLKLPKVVIPVHLCGQSCEMERIAALGKVYGFSIIEDASHAVGGRYKDGYVGSCEYSDITVFSFHPVKIITTAEGGLALTNSEKLADRMRLLRSHGVTRDHVHMFGDSHGPWYYEQIDLGFNYRMTDIQAALGVSQLRRLHEFVLRRNELAKRYDSRLKLLPVKCPKQINDSYSACHLYVIRLELDLINTSHKEVFVALREEKIGVNLHYIPVHTQPYYEGLGFKVGQFPESEKYYSEAISLPLFHSMSEEQQDTVIDKLKTVLV